MMTNYIDRIADCANQFISGFFVCLEIEKEKGTYHATAFSSLRRTRAPF